MLDGVRIHEDSGKVKGNCNRNRMDGGGIEKEEGRFTIKLTNAYAWYEEMKSV